MGNIQSDKRNFEKLGVLGEGASCQVYKVQHKKKKELFALKCLPRSVKENKELYQNERAILQLLKGLPNIVELHHAWSDRKFHHLLIEFAGGGDCFDRIRGRFSEIDASRMTKDMLISVQGCHKNYVAHRDLKPENFVFRTAEPDAGMLLIDFGVACQVRPGDKNVRNSSGSMYYIAPECLEMKPEGLSGEELRASDMWSIGVIAFLLVCGYPPFNGRTAEESFRATRAGVYRWPERERKRAPISPALKDFVDRLLVKDTESRMTVEEALKHPWIAEPEKVASQDPIPKEVLESLLGFHNHCKLKNAVGRVLARRMTSEDKERLQELFRRYDTNGDGRLSQEEITVMFEDLKLGGAQEAKRLHAMMDEDKNKGVDRDEFVRGMTVGALSRSTEEEIKRDFELFDADGDGFVTHNEIERLCSQFLTKDAIQELIQQVDQNQDGQISFEEWFTAMKSQPLQQLGRDSGDAGEQRREEEEWEIGMAEEVPTDDDDYDE